MGGSGSGPARPSGKRRRRHLWLALAALAARLAGAAEPTAQSVDPGQFKVKIEAGAIASLRSTRAGFNSEFVPPGQHIGNVMIRYREPGGNWQSVHTGELTGTAEFSTNVGMAGCRSLYRITNGTAARLILQTGIEVQEQSLCWTLNLQNASGQALEIGDLALPLMNSIFTDGAPGIMQHSFISGHGSHLFWMRSDSVGPYLTLTPTGDTHFEYWETQNGYQVFIHSAAAGTAAAEHGTRWHQPHTSLTLAPKGQPGDHHNYGFKFRWAENYDAVRNVLVAEGGVDVQVAPGMTVPADLFAECALRTTQEIHSVEAEFPKATQIEELGTNGEYHLYRVRFSKLGENRLTLHYGDHREMFLEFFSTEPVETLIRKRAAFISRCQHRNPAKWYDGLISDWNMETQVLLGPDNYDRIKGWRIYEVSCDDPGLSKPAFLAAKSAEFPVPAEVAALDYYLQHFVWGGLQRTTAESHPYAIYGIPDWKKNRESNDPGPRGRQHFWRVYDYPHLILVYHSLYRVAQNHPEIKTALTAKEYLQRAYGTALAMFTIPAEIDGWSAYETGFYNELVIENLIEDLASAGRTAEADRLRGFWERKVKTFVNGKVDVFRSEYAFDTTGFESTHALAQYAVQHADPPGETRTGITRADARRFMEYQMAANLFCRGWLEPAYYHLGSDYRGSGNSYNLSYMSQMGGWAVLDYGLNFASDPAPYLRLGYASYLSAWALMNTGTAESNYGYWYPGRGNDGGGWRRFRTIALRLDLAGATAPSRVLVLCLRDRPRLLWRPAHRGHGTGGRSDFRALLLRGRLAPGG